MASMEDLIATISGGMHVGQQANDLKDLQVCPLSYFVLCSIARAYHTDSFYRQNCRRRSTRPFQLIDPSHLPTRTTTPIPTRPSHQLLHPVGTLHPQPTVSYHHRLMPHVKWDTTPTVMATAMGMQTEAEEGTSGSPLPKLQRGYRRGTTTTTTRPRTV